MPVDGVLLDRLSACCDYRQHEVCCCFSQFTLRQFVLFGGKRRSRDAELGGSEGGTLACGRGRFLLLLGSDSRDHMSLLVETKRKRRANLPFSLACIGIASQMGCLKQHMVPFSPFWSQEVPDQGSDRFRFWCSLFLACMLLPFLPLLVSFLCPPTHVRRWTFFCLTVEGH